MGVLVVGGSRGGLVTIAGPRATPRIAKGGWDVGIGETLARARRDAGLSIAEVSSKTRIRRSVIGGIEHDDYSDCGGDFYARGNIRAIARVLGVDSGPLIEAYDAARRPAEWIAAAKPSEPITPAQAPGAVTPGAEPGPVTADEDTQPIAMDQPSEPVTAGEPPHRVTAGQLRHLITPAGTAARAGASGPVRQAFAGQRQNIWIALGAVLLAACVLGGILLVLGSDGQAARHAAVARQRHGTGGRGAAYPARTRQPSSGHSAGSPGPTPSASPANSRTPRALQPAGIAAFGTRGIGQGDSPQLARQALAGKAAAPWHSDWYTTPHFGNLQSGTGLLLDMGRKVTITSARITLGNSTGADLVLRIGNSPALASLAPAAHANRTGGVVQLKTAPTRGRYVLVWFTRLPPDHAGTFQVSVYHIKLRGYS